MRGTAVGCFMVGSVSGPAIGNIKPSLSLCMSLDLSD